MYFMVKPSIHTVRWSELHQNMPYLSPIYQYRILQNSVKTQKFCGNGQIQQLGSKFHVPQKTVVPTNYINSKFKCAVDQKQTGDTAHLLKNLTLSFYAYSCKEHSRQISSWSDLKWWSLRLFVKWHMAIILKVWHYIQNLTQSINAYLLAEQKVKSKGTVYPLMEVFHDTATECHLPYGITQCYLLPDTSEHTPP